MKISFYTWGVRWWYARWTGRWITISKITNMITAEHWRDAINSVLDDYGLSKEEFWKDPKKFLDNLDDMDAKLMIEFCMSLG